MLTLSKIKAYFEARQMATCDALALHFEVDQNSIKDMLRHFIHKGQIECKLLESACGSCQGCSKREQALYVWCPKKRKRPATLTA